jgi:FMN phosphatase YigB (HAD superfamily)
VPELVFLLDVDNTLLDNDFVKDDLGRRMSEFLKPDDAQRFWNLYEAIRHERDVVDFPLTLERFHEGYKDEPTFGRLCQLLDGYRFDKHLYPHALDAIRHLRTLGTTVVVSDGDTVFQPRKIAEAGITEAVGGQVFIYTHKEKSIAEVVERVPADRYVMVDDKRRILAALKSAYPERFGTVHVVQGHYAEADADLKPDPDIEVPAIGDLRQFGKEAFLGG